MGLLKSVLSPFLKILEPLIALMFGRSDSWWAWSVIVAVYSLILLGSIGRIEGVPAITHLALLGVFVAAASVSTALRRWYRRKPLDDAAKKAA